VQKQRQNRGRPSLVRPRVSETSGDGSELEGIRMKIECKTQLYGLIKASFPL
jgi:hypothetical protein